MDPLSIASAAGTIAQSAWKVYTFVNNAKNVDKTLREIQVEMKQVNDVFSLVQEQVQLVHSQDALLTAIQDQIDACAVPIQAIEGKLGTGGRKTSNIFKQAFRQIKLDMNEDDIERCRRQIQRCITNIQLSLQLVNLQATYLAPQQAGDILLVVLENIQRTLDTQGQKVDAAMRHCAGEYVSSGTTLYEESVRGGSFIDNSVNTVSSWLTQLSAMKVEEESPVLPNGNDSTVTDHVVSPAAVDATSNDGYDSDDSFSTEVAKSVLLQAEEALAAQQFDTAKSSFQEFLKCLEALPRHRRGGYDLERVTISLAICAYNLAKTPDNLSQAENDLAYVVGSETKEHNMTLRFRAAFCLAYLYTQTKRPALAVSTIENIYRGQRRLFGSNHEECFDTLAKLAQAYELQGNMARAKAYRSMIPEDLRDRYCKIEQKISETITSRSGSQETEPIETAVEPAFMAGTTLEALAWSSDGLLLALSLGGLYKAVEIRKADTRRLRLALKSKAIGPVTCLAFHPRMESIAGISNEQSQNPSTLYLRLWSVLSGDLLYKTALAIDIDSPRGDAIFFSYEEWVCGFRWASKGRTWWSCARLNAADGKMLSKVQVPPFKNMFQNEDGFGLVRDHDSNFQMEWLDRDLCRLGPWMSREPVCAAAKAPDDGKLWCVFTDGRVDQPTKERRISDWFRAHPEEGLDIRHATITFTRAGVLVTLVQLKDSGQIYLGAPWQKSWKKLGTEVVSAILGFSPHAEKAYWFTKNGNGAGSLRTIGIEDEP